ncbi:hypothetical protein SNR37_002667 [Agarivorans aestuarii]|uniref:Uncharacterized protein n=1 Tax=Agarivorans aestuarii TaxID=1563703 RepID=A0ABU7G1N1_9ALTE|nr:hypothetical protein [Agarivorans aestuarii]MEE1673253.1 hypothetical protein [Agarivorans aestuarii]
MNLTIKDFLLTVLATACGLSLTWGTAALAQTSESTGLRLESFSISPKDQANSEFGSWKLKGLTVADLWEPLQKFENRHLGYQQDASMWVYSNIPYVVNAEGIAVHKIFWQRDRANLEWLYPNNQSSESPWSAKQIPKSIRSEMLKDPKISKYAEFNEATPDYLWHGAAISYISGLIEPPKLKLVIRNQAESSAKVYGIRAKNLYSTGGDGEGELTYNLYILYDNGDERVEQFVGTFVQSDALRQMPLW